MYCWLTVDISCTVGLLSVMVIPIRRLNRHKWRVLIYMSASGAEYIVIGIKTIITIPMTACLLASV